MTIGDKILNMRKARGWSQEELADRVGVTRQAVSRWESGSAKPDADKIIDVCDLFGVSADYLLREKYAGEGELSSCSAAADAPEDGMDKSGVESAPMPQRPPAVTAVQILGILMILSAIALFCALGIMSALNPHLYIRDNIEYRGILGYILGNQLWWLVNADAVILLLGIFLLIGKGPFKRLVQWCKDRVGQYAVLAKLLILTAIGIVGALLLMIVLGLL